MVFAREIQGKAAHGGHFHMKALVHVILGNVIPRLSGICVGHSKSSFLHYRAMFVPCGCLRPQQGAARVIQTDALGDSQEIARLDAGHYFGEVCPYMAI